MRQHVQKLYAVAKWMKPPDKPAYWFRTGPLSGSVKLAWIAALFPGEAAYTEAELQRKLSELDRLKYRVCEFEVKCLTEATGESPTDAAVFSDK